MTDKEKREFKDGVISIFKRFNILDHAATIGGLRDDILRYIDSLQEEPVSKDYRERYKRIAESEEFRKNYDGMSIGDIVPVEEQEPVSEDLEEASKNYALNNTPWDDCKDEIQESFKAGAQWQKAKDKSVTNDLGEYINELSKQFPEVSFAKLSRIAVRMAKWQKQQDQSTIELAEDHAMLAGMDKMKEQMVKNAVGVDYDNLVAYNIIYHICKVLGKGGKGKLVIIKED